MKKPPLSIRLILLSITIMLQASRSSGQSQQLYEAFQNGRSGLIDIAGNWVLKPQFDSIYEVKYHHVYFYRDSLMGVANMRGKVTVQPAWKELMYDDYGLALATDGRGTTYIKVKNGKRICGYYRDAGMFSDGISTVQDSSGKWGAIDQYGRRAIPCVYDSLEDFEHGKARAWRAGKSCFIDPENRETESPESYQAWRSTDRWPYITRNGKRGAVSSKGDTVFQPVYDYLSYSTYDNACTFCRAGKCGVADTLGKIFIQPKYDYLNYFSPTSLNVACLAGKWGVIDGAEQVIIPFVYDQLHELGSDHFAASYKGQWGILDKAGEWILATRFERIRNWFFDEDEEEASPYGSRRGFRSYTSSYELSGSDDGIAVDLTPVPDRQPAVEIKVFPNPTSGHFAIQLPAIRTASYRIYDGKGAMVLSGSLPGRTTEADITTLPVAAYTLVVYYDERVYNFRLTKQ